MSPSLSVIIPTYNCAPLLETLLQHLDNQDYPRHQLQIVIADGMSVDATRETARAHGAVVVDNHKLSWPWGRMIALPHCSGDILAFLDSDNIPTSHDWLRRMTAPFADQEIAAAEPLYYAARDTDTLITRYIALLGADDPLMVYTGFHDRFSSLTGTWTGCPVSETQHPGYTRIRFLDPSRIPSLGANGFFVRRRLLAQTASGPMYHVNTAHQLIAEGNSVWAKVDVGIIHQQQTSLWRFMRKKSRRAQRRLQKKQQFGYRYPISRSAWALLFIKSLTVIPILFDALRGALRKRSWIWALHPVIHYGTLAVYATSTIRSLFVRRIDESYEQAGVRVPEKKQGAL